MSGFKLLAIRPIAGCDSRFLKNLKEGMIYKLYNGYDFIVKENDVIKIVDESTIPNNLFGENINVSAIVGKNGSGKSALIELFVASLNQFSYYLKEKAIIGKKQIVTDADLQSIEFADNSDGINAEIFFLRDDEFYNLKIHENEFHHLYNISQQTLIIKKKLSDFFYTLIINYSIYSFNPHVLGRSVDFHNSSNHWIDGLFHKNDSYQIPIVINPKRESAGNTFGGVIDVNNEQDLLQQRLLYNILKHYDDEYDQHLKLTENRKAVTILKANKPYQKITTYLKMGTDNLEIQDRVISNPEAFWIRGVHNPLGQALQIRNAFDAERLPIVFWKYDQVLLNTLLEFKIDAEKNPFLGKCYEYIVYKIFSICAKYPDYQVFLMPSEYSNELTVDIKSFLLYIKKSANRSHITNKLMQVINFIKFYDEIWTKYSHNSKIDIESLSKDLDELAKSCKLPLIEILPPPIFAIRIEVDEFIENKEQNKIITIDKLSSGEQQLIHATSTIFYHLNNLQSVRQTELINKYDCVNLIFDEIELYFHPDYQRKLLKNILEGIKNNQFDNIRINILFITHSPFVLSDIPNQNILKLDEGNIIDSEISENTFGANIHDLLANDFFLKDGFMGEFAKSEINNVINFLNNQKLEKRNQFLAVRIKKSASPKEKEEMELEITRNNRKIEIDKILEPKYDQQYCYKLIELVGEPILSSSLMELYVEAYPAEKESYISAQIQRLSNLRKK